jgi:ketosteroid isomerase-like protein
VMSFYAPDAVMHAARLGTSSEGVAAMRDFFEDWIGGYEDFHFEPVEMSDLGKGVIYAVISQGGRPGGSAGQVLERIVVVFTYEEGLIVRVAAYGDVDEARAAAERLAKERG